MQSRINKAKLTGEQQVLLAALRIDRAQDNHMRELLKAGVDWRVLRHTALQHGVLPLLYVRLQELGPDLLPQQERAQLQESFRANSRRNLLMAAELVKALKLLKAHDIIAIPFKGPVLAVQAYGDLCLRQFSDLDLLVRREDLKKVEQLLVGHGYRLWYAFTPLQKKSHLKRTCELTFLPGQGLASLDVHWRFAADYFTARLSPDAAFAAYETARLEGHEVPMLPADMMLPYLCLHGTFHLWPTLSSISDVARCIETSKNPDWPQLLDMAERAGLRRTVLLGLGLAQDLMGVNLPEEITAALAESRAVKTLQEHVRARLFSRSGRGPGFAETARFQVLAKDRFSDRLRYCLIRAFVPTIEDWKTCRLPDSLYFFYFILRLLRLARNRKYVSRAQR